jgi:hypothetical protein
VHPDFLFFASWASPGFTVSHECHFLDCVAGLGLGFPGALLPYWIARRYIGMHRRANPGRKIPVRWLRRPPGCRSARVARSSATKTARGHHQPLARPSRVVRPSADTAGEALPGFGAGPGSGPEPITEPDWDERVLRTLGSVAASFRLLCAQLTESLARSGGYADRYSSALARWIRGTVPGSTPPTGTPVTSCGSSSTRICSPPRDTRGPDA